MLIQEAGFKSLEELSCSRSRYPGDIEDSPGPTTEFWGGTEGTLLNLTMGLPCLILMYPLMQALFALFCGMCFVYFETRSSMLPMLVFELVRSRNPPASTSRVAEPISMYTHAQLCCRLLSNMTYL